MNWTADISKDTVGTVVTSPNPIFLQSQNSRDLSLPVLTITKSNSSMPFRGQGMNGSELSGSWLLALKGEFTETDNLFLNNELTLKSLLTAPSLIYGLYFKMNY